MDWFGTFLTVWGFYFNAQKRLWCWPIWIGSNTCWTYYAYHHGHQWGLITTNIILFGFNVYGWCCWARAKPVLEGDAVQ